VRRAAHRRAHPTQILLFDLDGVLVQSGGYHASLREVVRLAGRALGFPKAELPASAIALFEAAGVTAEWDSSACCVALLQRSAWQVNPGCAWPNSPPLPNCPSHDLPAPDFEAFARRLLVCGDDGLPIPARLEAALSEGSRRDPLSQSGVLAGLVRSARDLKGSLTHQLIQEFNLGSARFAALYGLPPCLDTPSRLETEDRPALDDAGRRGLRGWLARTGHGAAVFTNRPSLPPDASFGVPEAEMGLQSAGLPELPVIGMGPLSWLSDKRGEGLQAFLKPSPVHALAALRLAAGDPVERAVDAAARLVLDGDSHGWEVLDGARVWVFEDSARGMLSAIDAAGRLQAAGFEVHLTPIGVTDSPEKAEALSDLGARVVPMLRDGLREGPGL